MRHSTHRHLFCSFFSRNNVALQYVRGLCWVLRYYYQGCASWRWYFPYHYAPFASDFINIGGLSTEFEKDTVPVRFCKMYMRLRVFISSDLMISFYSFVH